MFWLFNATLKTSWKQLLSLFLGFIVVFWFSGDNTTSQDY